MSSGLSWRQERSKSRLRTQDEVLAAAEKEYNAREAARERLIPFCEYTWMGFERRPHRELIAAALELVDSGQIQRLMIFCPPQYGKSEIVTRRFPAWYLGRHPDNEIILASYSADLAGNLASDARDLVMSDAYSRVFGAKSCFDASPVEISSAKAATKEWRIKGYRGRMKSAGIGGGITGHAAKLAILDDPVKDDDEATSEIIVARNKSWYLTSLYTRVDPNKGAIIITMTRWADDDLAGWQLSRQEDPLADKWYVLRLTASAETPEQIEEWCERSFVPPERYLVADYVT